MPSTSPARIWSAAYFTSEISGVSLLIFRISARTALLPARFRLEYFVGGTYHNTARGCKAGWPAYHSGDSQDIRRAFAMKKLSESHLSLQHRLRRIEGRHNPLVKQLRQAFSRAELTDGGDCAIEGFRILEEAIRSGLRFSAVFFRESALDRAERLLPQIGAQVETL